MKKKNVSVDSTVYSVDGNECPKLRKEFSWKQCA